MLTKKRYSVKDMVLWTRGETLIYLFYAGIITILYKVFGFTFLNVPWTPVALIGTAVAFLVGFQNQSAYGRIWEARKIWGAIVNTSRTWGMKVQDMVTDEYCDESVSESELKKHKKILVYRHIAWMTALRYAMRTRKSWETQHKANSHIKPFSFNSLMCLDCKYNNAACLLLLDRTYFLSSSDKYIIRLSSKVETSTGI